MEWLRLWHDMPSDPKFRTIARASKQTVANVVACFVVILVDASANASERGRTLITDEDIAANLDLETETVTTIRKAMEGRLIDNGKLLGWDRRQSKKEDDSAGRSKAWREKKKLEEEIERLRTLANACEREQPDLNTRLDKRREDKEEEKSKPSSVAAAVVETHTRDDGEETEEQRRLRKACSKIKPKILDRFPHAEPVFDLEVDKIVAFYAKRNIGADPALIIWKWFERVKAPPPDQPSANGEYVPDEDDLLVIATLKREGLWDE